jgi:chemotaxis protein MotB
MGRPAKKPEEPKKGAPLWMATFSDMVTLLLTFFVLLVSMASFDDNAKVESAMESFHNRFGSDLSNPELIGMGPNRGFVDSIAMVNHPTPDNVPLKDGFAQFLAAVTTRGQGHNTELHLALDDDHVFPPATSQLHPSALPGVRILAELANRYPDLAIEVVGHTDNTGDDVAADWRLSLDRAMALLDELQGYAVDPARLTAVGMGPHHPATSTGDQIADRRVEIVLRGEIALVEQAKAEMLQPSAAEPEPKNQPSEGEHGG